MLEEKSQGLNKEVRNFVETTNRNLHNQLNSFADKRDALGVLVVQLIVTIRQEVDAETAEKYLGDIVSDILRCVDDPRLPTADLRTNPADERKS